jgi:DNA-binding LacI/PurR family transcriptional regulator
MTSAGRSRGRATIVDVARAAQVSRQTVSNAVNNPQRVAPETLERVHREIERLGFRPSLAARSLKQERANALGIELNSLGVRRLGSILDSFFVELTVASRHRDAHLVPFAAAEHDRPIPAYQDLVASNLVDAFILTDTRRDDPRPPWLREQGVPFAAFGRIWDDPSFTWWVDVDGRAGVTTAVRHLFEAGYQRVGFLGWPSGSPVGDERRDGWSSATREGGAPNAAWQASSQQDVNLAAAAVAPVVDAIGPGGAVACASDTLAMGAWMVLRERGMAPGRDFGIVGFDDSDLAASFNLTSLRQPLHEVAEQVLAILDDGRAGRAMPGHGRMLQPTLVPRGSTDRSAPPPVAGAWNDAGNRTDNGGNE